MLRTSASTIALHALHTGNTTSGGPQRLQPPAVPAHHPENRASPFRDGSRGRQRGQTFQETERLF
eukprot:6878932-Pyramimonas_sp.AAC.2